MKLYISYYGSYVSIVEGLYNKKKNKFTIKDSFTLSSDDLNIDYSDKYSLLKEALTMIKTKTKNAVLLLNTRDVLVKHSETAKMKPKDLDGIMEHEMYEIMSLDEEQYTFSYEVVKEKSDDGKEILDLIVAAVRNEEINDLTNLFKQFKLNLERIDTIATAYSRLLKSIEYKNIMMLNIGGYGSIVNIYEEDNLFIYDNVPVKIGDNANYAICSALEDEVRGLMNFYSSRHYGSSIDTITIVGQSYENKEITNYFKENFNNSIIQGIENLFDIEDDIQGNLQEVELSKICDILGSMSISLDKKSYPCMNLLPLKQRSKQQKKDTVRQYILAGPIALGLISAPYFIFGTLNLTVLNETSIAQAKLDEIILEHKGIEDINKRIDKAKEEIEIYDMLESKGITWDDMLTAIDKNTPYKVDLTNLSVVYEEPELTEEELNEENKNDSQGTQEEGEEEVVETPIYEKIPNTINIEGITNSPDYVGQFVYNLNKLPYFKSVALKSSVEDKEKGVQNFNIVLSLKEGAVSNE
ncbi:MAG: PilN domain-containing protein [Peptostreptococcaceae bacterium]